MNRHVYTEDRTAERFPLYVDSYAHDIEGHFNLLSSLKQRTT